MALDNYKTALVTGASSGIGAAVVTALRARGLTVIAAARRAERLEALAKETGCAPLVLDVRDTEALYHALGGLEVDILVNNAGLGRGFCSGTISTGSGRSASSTTTGRCHRDTRPPRWRWRWRSTSCGRATGRSILAGRC